jgi:hypothetical protein
MLQRVLLAMLIGFISLAKAESALLYDVEV